MLAFASSFAIAHALSAPRLTRHNRRQLKFQVPPHRSVSTYSPSRPRRHNTGNKVRCIATEGQSTVLQTERELPSATKAIITATVPALKAHGVEIITTFYSLLFDRHPSVQRYFNMDRQAKGKTMTEGTPAQIAALARSVLAYASNIEDLTPILPRIVSICHKHVSRGVIGPHCTYVHSYINICN